MICVETAYWHTFISSGGADNEDSCLTCGALYQRVPVPDRDGYEKYVNASGDDATECTGRTDLVHGYERHCENDNGRSCEAFTETGECEHTNHTCNCIQCN